MFYYHILIPSEKISCIYLLLNIIKNGIIAVSNDAAASFLELLEIIDNKGTEGEDIYLYSYQLLIYKLQTVFILMYFLCSKGKFSADTSEVFIPDNAMILP